MSATSAQFFRYLWFMPSLGVRSPWLHAYVLENSLFENLAVQIYFIIDFWLCYIHFLADWRTKVRSYKKKEVLGFLSSQRWSYEMSVSERTIFLLYFCFTIHTLFKAELTPYQLMQIRVKMHHSFIPNLTMRTSLLNWCTLVSISKNVVFYAFLVVRIY